MPFAARARAWAPPSHDSRRLASPPRAPQAAFRELPDSDAGLQAALHEFHDQSAAYASNRLSLCPDSQRGKYRAMMAAHMHLAGDTAAALQRHNDAKAAAKAAAGIVTGAVDTTTAVDAAAAAVTSAPADAAAVTGVKRERENDDASEQQRPSQVARAATPPPERSEPAQVQFMTWVLAHADAQLTASGARCTRCLQSGLTMVKAPNGPGGLCVGCLDKWYLKFGNGGGAATPPHPPVAEEAQPQPADAAAAAPEALAAAPPAVAAAPPLLVELQKTGGKPCAAELLPTAAAGAAACSPPQPLPSTLNVSARCLPAPAVSKVVNAPAARRHAWNVLSAGARGHHVTLREFSDEVLSKPRQHADGETVGVVTENLPPGGRMFLFPSQEAGAARNALGLPAAPDAAVMLAVYVAPAPLS